jgi:hypothetical protein
VFGELVFGGIRSLEIGSKSWKMGAAFGGEGFKSLSIAIWCALFRV